MEKQPRILRIIIVIINMLCLLQGLGTALSLVLIPFLPPFFTFNFSVKADGIFGSLEEGLFPFSIPEVVGLAFFDQNSPPNYLLNFSWFLLCLLVLFILFQFKDFVQSVSEKRAFEPENYKRFRNMGFALLGGLMIETLRFLFIETPMAKLVEHESIIIHTSFHFGNNVNWNWLFLGLTFLVLGEVFKEGFSLKQEIGLTI